MSKIIRFRRNTKANIPTLQLAEPFWATDEKKLYVGDGSVNHEVSGDEVTLASLGLPSTLQTFSVPADTLISSYTRPALSAADSSAVWGVLGVSSYMQPVLNAPDSAAAKSILGITEDNTSPPDIYPESYGAIGDGVTDDSEALQDCFNAVAALTYRPRIVFKSAKYHIHTGLTIPYAQGMWLAGTGGFYTPQAAGYTDKVTTLDYSGNGVALTIGDGSQNATGFIAEKIYVKGTAAGVAGFKLNTTGGIVFKDCTFGQFSGSGLCGLWILKTQVCSIFNCAFIGNYYGCYHEGNASENTTLRYHDCMWHSNTIGLREECGVQTTIINPVFQSQAGSAISVDCSSGPWLSNNLIIHGGYFSGNNESVAGMTIEIRGDGTSGNTYHQGLHISNLYFGSPGAAQTAFIWLRYTTGAVLERLRFASITDDVIIAHPSYNDSLELRDWPYGATYVKEAVGGGTVNWMKTTFSDDYTKLFQGGSVKIHQENSGGAAPALLIQQDDQDFAFVDFIGTSEASSNKNLSTWTNAAINGFIRVKINGTNRWIPYYTAPTS